MKNKEQRKKSSMEHSDQMHTKCTEQSIWNFARGKDKVTQRSKPIRIIFVLSLEALTLKKVPDDCSIETTIAGPDYYNQEKINQNRWRKKIILQ